jgi:hypothetical protein
MGDVIVRINGIDAAEQALGPRRSQPRFACAGLGQDRRHRLRVDRADLGVRFGCQHPIEIGGDLAFLPLPHRGPARPDTAGGKPARRNVELEELKEPLAAMQSQLAKLVKEG